MLVRPHYPEIKLNLYLGTEIVFEVLNQAEVMNVRAQICEQNLEGYYLKVDSVYWYLFDKEDEIHNEVVRIDSSGKVDHWFTGTIGNDKLWDDVLNQCLRLRSAQIEKENNEHIHTETREGV